MNKTKYPDYIVEAVRQNLGLDYSDGSKDDDINQMDSDDVLESYWAWNGIIGYADQMKESVGDIYGIDFETKVFYKM